MIIALILVEREVLVDILHVRSCLVGGVIRLRAVIGIRRVTLGVVDTLVALQDALLLIIEVRAAIVVIVIARRVVTPSLDDTVVGDDAAVDDGIKPLLIRTVLALLLVVESVETYVLPDA